MAKMEFNQLKRCIAQRKRNTSRFMLVFAIFLLSYLIYIQTAYRGTMISSTNNYRISTRSLRKEKNANPIKQQEVILVYGTMSSGYLQVQNDFSLWSQQFHMYPWSWAVPEISSEQYQKVQQFEPFMRSLKHYTTTVPESQRLDTTERSRVNYYISKFRDGFVDQWMQNKNILIGSDTFSIILDAIDGDNFFNALEKTMPWNDPRYSNLKEGRISFLILHRSSHQDHLKQMWQRKVVADGNLNNEKFSSWFANEFNFDDIDFFGLAYKLAKQGTSVTLVDVDFVDENLSQYICKNILQSCSNQDGNKLKTSESYDVKSEAIAKKTDLDITDKTLSLIANAIKKHENKLQACLQGVKNFQMYPVTNIKQTDNLASDLDCSDSNHSVKNELRKIGALKMKQM